MLKVNLGMMGDDAVGHVWILGQYVGSNVLARQRLRARLRRDLRLQWRGNDVSTPEAVHVETADGTRFIWEETPKHTGF